MGRREESVSLPKAYLPKGSAQGMMSLVLGSHFMLVNRMEASQPWRIK